MAEMMKLHWSPRVFVVRRDAPFHFAADLRDCDFVYNSLHSSSAMNMPHA